MAENACPNCGTLNVPNSMFCVRCGSAMQGQAAPQAPQVAPGPGGPGSQPNAFWNAPQQPAPRATPAADLGKFLFMSSVIKHVSDGGLFRRIVSIFLLITAVLIGIGGLVSVVAVANGFFEMSEPAAILGGLLAVLLTIMWVYAMVHTLVIRAAHVRDLPESEFTVIPIVSVMFRLTGELAAITFVYSGFVGMVGMWFIGTILGSIPMSPLGYGYGYGYGMGLPTGSTFLAGIVTLISGLAGAFVLLLVFYLAAEGVMLLASIAQDTKALRRSSEAQAPVRAAS